MSKQLPNTKTPTSRHNQRQFGFLGSFWCGVLRECRRLSSSPWDLFVLFGIPLLVIVLFGSLFIGVKAQHLPVMVIDQDQSTLSRTIIRHINASQTLTITDISTNPQAAEHAINTLAIGGYLQIPQGAEKRLVRGDDAGIAIMHNQSFYSWGSGTASALSSATHAGVRQFLSQEHFDGLLPHLARTRSHIKIAVLFNPQMSYELFLEPFLVPAVLHLLLSCLIAFAIGMEFKQNTLSDWLGRSPVSAFFGKISVYVAIICLWHWLWLTWLVGVRGYFIAGSGVVLIVAQGLFYWAYALFGALIILITQDANKSFGLLAVYGGSSMSFAGVSLPLNNASGFAKFWSNIIPFTSYAKIQTQSWIIGTPTANILPQLAVLMVFVVIFGIASVLLLQKLHHKRHNQVQNQGQNQGNPS
ncbi:ABC transporter permease [Moraxella sp. ZJ142]|uniref:ABC transporter permease n=1 Tax=Moraxella marmotae TaxID=3344520 RepID=UPI0035D448FB